LSAEANFAGDGIRFAVSCRKLCQTKHDIRCVLSNACEIYDGNRHEAKAYLILRRIQKEMSRQATPKSKNPASYNLRPGEIAVNRLILSAQV